MDNNPDGVPSDVHLQVIEKYTPPVYPPPVITEAVNGVLDVGALTKNATVTVAAWPGIAVGQKIWLSMVSTPPVTLTKWVGFPITNTGAQSTTISLDKLKTLVDGSTIELHFEVSFDGGVTKVPFPVSTYTVKTLVALDLRFTESTYTAAQEGLIKDILVQATRGSAVPAPGQTITLTLPSGFTYADNGSGDRSFITDSDGRIRVSGVRGGTEIGVQTITARSGPSSATATIDINRIGIISTIPVGAALDAIAVSPDGALVYVGVGSNQVYPITFAAIDVATNRVIKTLKFGHGSIDNIAFASDGGVAYMTNPGSHSVFVIETTNHSVVKTITGAFLGPNGVVVSPNTNRAYVSNTSFPLTGPYENSVAVIDTSSHTVLHNIPGFNRPQYLAMSPDGSRLYVSGGVVGAYALWVVDTVSNSIIRTVSLPGICRSITAAPDGSRVYVTINNGAIYTVDPSGGSFSSWLSPPAAIPWWVPSSFDSRRLYAPMLNESMAVIDTIGKRITLTVDIGSSGMSAISPNNTRLYVVGGGNKYSVLVISI